MQDPYIFTYTGRKFYYLHPEPDMIDIEDIAHALANLCRFVGHTSSFYSVAAHSMLVADKIPGPPELKLAALLHDAAEAYTGDMSSPLKKCVNGDFARIQDDITTVIYGKYGVPWLKEPAEIKRYDEAACLLEHEVLWLEPKPDQLGIDPALRGLWQPWDRRDMINFDREAKVLFLDTFYDYRGQMLLGGYGDAT